MIIFPAFCCSPEQTCAPSVRGSRHFSSGWMRLCPYLLMSSRCGLTQLVRFREMTGYAGETLKVEGVAVQWVSRGSHNFAQLRRTKGRYCTQTLLCPLDLSSCSSILTCIETLKFLLQAELGTPLTIANEMWAGMQSPPRAASRTGFWLVLSAEVSGFH